jgi:hypothetical protein
VLVSGGHDASGAYAQSGDKRIPLAPPEGTDMAAHTYTLTGLSADGRVVVGSLTDDSGNSTPLVWRC